jgi:hypothetical protein
MQGMYVSSDCNKIGISQQWWWWQRCRYEDSVDKARARGQWCRTSTGKERVMQQRYHNRSDEGEGKELGKGTNQLSMLVGHKGYNGGAALK